jgi:hypothetical protein
MDSHGFVGCQTTRDKPVSQLESREKRGCVKASSAMTKREGLVQIVLISVNVNLLILAASSLFYHTLSYLGI